jgi:hypothetical protein
MFSIKIPHQLTPLIQMLKIIEKERYHISHPYMKESFELQSNQKMPT